MPYSAQVTVAIEVKDGPPAHKQTFSVNVDLPTLATAEIPAAKDNDTPGVKEIYLGGIANSRITLVLITAQDGKGNPAYEREGCPNPKRLQWYFSDTSSNAAGTWFDMLYARYYDENTKTKLPKDPLQWIIFKNPFDFPVTVKAFIGQQAPVPAPA